MLHLRHKPCCALLLPCRCSPLFQLDIPAQQALAPSSVPMQHQLPTCTMRRSTRFSRNGAMLRWASYSASST